MKSYQWEKEVFKQTENPFKRNPKSLVPKKGEHY